MARRSILSVAERESLIAFSHGNLIIQFHTLSESDIAIIKHRRGAENRLGFGVQLCYLRYPGIILGTKEKASSEVIEFVAQQLEISPSNWELYGNRQNTIHEHLRELQSIFGFKSFTMQIYAESLKFLDSVAMQTNKGIVLATTLVEHLRAKLILLPSVNVIERLCSEAITKANRQIYQKLTESLSSEHHSKLDDLLKLKPDSNFTWLVWLRQTPRKPSSPQMLEHIERLNTLKNINLPVQPNNTDIHQNRLLKIAREGEKMTPRDLAKFEPVRRYATLVALVLETTATITDEIIDLHDRIIGRLANAAKKKHRDQFQKSGKSINHKVRLYHQVGQALLDAKQNGTDAFEAVESVISWADFEASITEAQKLEQPENFDGLVFMGDSYNTLRRYTPAFLKALNIQATPAAEDIVRAIEILRTLNAENGRKLPENTPISFVKKRWQDLVIKDNGIDRRYYELCVFSELKNVLRSGDVWVENSRQFKEFNAYLIPSTKFEILKKNNELPLNVNQDCNLYLQERLKLLEEKLEQVNKLAASGNLPDAIIDESGLKITPLDAVIPEKAKDFIAQATALKNY